MDELKTAAAYIRVSTEEQTELSPDSQIKLVHEYAKTHGYIIPREYIFRDDGISGRRADKRPQFNNMIATSKQKPAPFSAVLLWKFSRFARNQEESIFYKSMLRKSGIEVISISEPLVEGPFGTLIERIIEWSDEYYSIRLSGEVRRGMTEKIERGLPVVPPPLGYVMKDKRYIVDPETAPIIKKIYSDYLNGSSIVRITRNLNDMKIRTGYGNSWENRTVEYILRNPTYIGKLRWNGKRRVRRDYNDPDTMIVDGQHEPIIDPQTFAAAQKKIEETKKKYPRHMHTNITEEYMLHGLVKCSACGYSLCAALKGTSLQCVGYTHGRCNVSHSITIKKLSDIVISTIEQSFAAGVFNLTVKESKKDPDAVAPDINTLIAKEEKKLSRIREAYEDGVYTLAEFKKSKQTAEKNIESLRKTLEVQQPSTQELRKKLIEKTKPLIPQLKSDNVSEAEKNEILRSFVDKIIFNRPKSTIEIFFYI